MSTNPPELTITHTVIDDRLVVSVCGDLDLGSASSLEAALRGLAPFEHAVVIDLAGVDFIDSSGVRSLLAVNQMVADAVGTPVVLTGGTPATRRLIELTGIDQVLAVEE